jgi:hypothetical protein
MEGQMLKYLAFSAIGEVLLFLGLIFVFLGVSAFVSDFLKIKGAGELSVGIALVVAAFVLLMRTRKMPIKVRVQKPPQPKAPPMDSYR